MAWLIRVWEVVEPSGPAHDCESGADTSRRVRAASCPSVARSGGLPRSGALVVAVSSFSHGVGVWLVGPALVEVMADWSGPEGLASKRVVAGQQVQDSGTRLLVRSSQAIVGSHKQTQEPYFVLPSGSPAR